jgi:hypothetical protein
MDEGVDVVHGVRHGRAGETGIKQATSDLYLSDHRAIGRRADSPRRQIFA